MPTYVIDSSDLAEAIENIPTLGKMILWNGSAWVNVDGTNV